jgi:hypothetical protein
MYEQKVPKKKESIALSSRGKIYADMQELFKKRTDKNMHTLSKEDVFKEVKGIKDDKEDMFKRLLEEGMIFERKQGRFSYIGGF